MHLKSALNVDALKKCVILWCWKTTLQKMKAIINGVRFDTEKAIEIGSASYNGSVTDFQWWESTLYKTPKSGRYFLAGEGGPMSRYARSLGQNSTGGGSAIHPMEEQEALAWAEQYLDSDEIEEHFGHLIEEA